MLARFDWLMLSSVTRQARKLECEPLRETPRKMRAAMIAAKYFQPRNEHFHAKNLKV